MQENKSTILDKFFRSFENNIGASVFIEEIFTNPEILKLKNNKEKIEKIEKKIKTILNEIEDEIKKTIRNENITSSKEYVSNKKTLDMSKKYGIMKKVFENAVNILKEMSKENENFDIKKSIKDIINLAQAEAAKEVAPEYSKLQDSIYKEDEERILENLKRKNYFNNAGKMNKKNNSGINMELKNK